MRAKSEPGWPVFDVHMYIELFVLVGGRNSHAHITISPRYSLEATGRPKHLCITYCAFDTRHYYKYPTMSKRWARVIWMGNCFLLFSRYAILEVGSYDMIQMEWSGVGVC